MAANAFASPYEWFDYLWSGPNKVVKSGTFNADDPTNSNKIYWNVSTSGNYYEYRALYLNNTPAYSLSDSSDWTRVTHCDKAGYVNGWSLDGCFNIPFTGFSSGSHVAFITTNWAGCGTYTPVPDTSSCGDRTDTFLLMLG
ncbi:TPA: hypothetical protein EYP38_05155 [Candidatus Micrarchaeota archaeon]|nr:hypothetical protein [Candidatus Micrarchaeota archaeon]